MPGVTIIALIGAAIACLITLLTKIPEPMLRNTQMLIFNPDRYHGGSETHRFFEGWYYKLVQPQHQEEGSRLSMAVVPGVFMGETIHSNESHAFIFVTLNGEAQHYFRFALEEIRYASPEEEYYIQVGDNRFSPTSMSLNLFPRDGIDEDANLTLKGELSFSESSPWPISFFGLGAMGVVGWMPSLECTHGVLSFDHILHGSLRINGESVSMNEGRGYTEKDYGRSFPSLWIWIQTNSFRNHVGTSLFLSVARVPTPFFGLEFPGFTAAIWHGGEIIPFATYTGARFIELRIDTEELYIAIRGSKGYRVELTVDRRVPHVKLYAPVNFTRMEPFVDEALHAKVHMRLYQNENLILDDIGDHAGLEVHQNVEWLVQNICGKKGANKILCL